MYLQTAREHKTSAVPPQAGIVGCYCEGTLSNVDLSDMSSAGTNFREKRRILAGETYWLEKARRM